MDLKPLTPGDLLTSISLLLTMAGLFFTGLQISRNNKIVRAQFLLDVTARYFSDAEVRQFFYDLDYGKFQFDPRTLPMSSSEKPLDNLLYTLDTIAQIVRLDVLSVDEIKILAFQASRVLQNEQVQRYLAWLEVQYEQFGNASTTLKPHADAIWLGERLLGKRMDYSKYKPEYMNNSKYYKQ